MSEDTTKHRVYFNRNFHPEYSRDERVMSALDKAFKEMDLPFVGSMSWETIEEHTRRIRKWYVDESYDEYGWLWLNFNRWWMMDDFASERSG